MCCCYGPLAGKGRTDERDSPPVSGLKGVLVFEEGDTSDNGTDLDVPLTVRQTGTIGSVRWTYYAPETDSFSISDQ